MSTVKTNNVQLGQSLTASQNFTWYQPASPDGTVRLGNGNAGSVTDLVTLTSAGNLGIGTVTPTTKLHVSGTGSTPSLFERTGSNGVYLQLKDASGSSVYLGASNGVFAIQTPGNSYSDKLVIDSSGNLGLGVTPSAWGSSYKAMQITGGSLTSYSTVTLEMWQNVYDTGVGSFRYVTTNSASRYQQASGEHRFFTAPSGTAGNAISFTQAMTLTASGELLVGSTNTIGSCKASVLFTNGTNNGFAVYDVASSGTANMVLFYRGGSQVGSITSTSSTTAFNPSSDISLKENIKPITNGLERVAKLKPVDYNWKSDGVLDNGFIAQDLLATEEFAHRCNSIETKEDGTKVYGVDYMKFVAVLTAAIQELSAEIETLKQKVNA